MHAREIRRLVIAAATTTSTTTTTTTTAISCYHDSVDLHTWNAVQLEKLSVMHTTYLLGPALLEAMVGSMMSLASRRAAVNDVNGRWTMGVTASSIRIRENFKCMVL